MFFLIAEASRFNGTDLDGRAMNVSEAKPMVPRNEGSRGSYRRGGMVSILGKSGKLRTYTVIELYSDMASLDENHPLAGQDLIFEIEALSVRAATRDEIHESLNMIGTQILH